MDFWFNWTEESNCCPENASHHTPPSFWSEQLEVRCLSWVKLFESIQHFQFNWWDFSKRIFVRKAHLWWFCSPLNPPNLAKTGAPCRRRSRWQWPYLNNGWNFETHQVADIGQPNKDNPPQDSSWKEILNFRFTTTLQLFSCAQSLNSIASIVVLAACSFSQQFSGPFWGDRKSDASMSRLVEHQTLEINVTKNPI